MSANNTSILGWWFSERKTLAHGDGRRIRIGGAHTIKGDIVPCQRGVHFSVRPIDALQYAMGAIVYRVRGSGTIVRCDDQIVCSRREYVAGGVDGTETLRHFARLCALDVVHLWDAPRVVVRYLRTGDPALRDAAMAAAFAASRAAERTDASDAAGATAGDAARAAARATQNTRLHRMLLEVIR